MIPVAASTIDVDAVLEGHRRELTAHCYRMLGSPFEADDAVQETFVRAWRHRDGVDPTTWRPWLYRVATNVCLDLLRAWRRHQDRADPTGDGVAGSLLERLDPGDFAWPMPARLVVDPADVAADTDTVRLAFVSALQRLPPRQRAVLILRDVLRWPAADVAQLLGTTVTAVNSGLRRARTTLDATSSGSGGKVDDALVARYVDAFRRYDVEELSTLLAEDVRVSMPPYTLRFAGRRPFLQWLARQRATCSDKLVTIIGGELEPTLAIRSLASVHEPGHAWIQTLGGDRGRITSIVAHLDAGIHDLFTRAGGDVDAP